MPIYPTLFFNAYLLKFLSSRSFLWYITWSSDQGLQEGLYHGFTASCSNQSSQYGIPSTHWHHFHLSTCFVFVRQCHVASHKSLPDTWDDHCAGLIPLAFSKRRHQSKEWHGKWVMICKMWLQASSIALNVWSDWEKGQGTAALSGIKRRKVMERRHRASEQRKEPWK